MRRATKAALAILICSILSVAAPTLARADVSFQIFYSNLSPHGHWHVSAGYGRVWQPDVYAPGWNPYLDGHWVYTDVGWTWVSDYAWGGIPYHYGTWVMDPALGWVWVPGYVWAPAWVVFRTSPDYIGWAPVSPGFRIGVASSTPASSSFIFVATGGFTAPHIRAHVITGARRATVVRKTTVVNRISVRNNIVVNHGPEVDRVERASGRVIRPVRIERVPRAGPAWRTRREDLHVRYDHPGAALRAAQPESARHPLPEAAARDHGRGHGSEHGQGGGKGKGHGKSKGHGGDR